MKKKPSRLSASWKNIFTFSAGEKRGVYLLLIALMILAAAIWFYRYYPPAFPKQDFTKFDKEVDMFLAEQKRQDSVNTMLLAEKQGSLLRGGDSSRESYTGKKEKPAITYFDFDPNNLPDEKWKQLGLNDGQIRVINNYQVKGGKFRKKEDLKKLYVLENDYARLEPYIKIKKSPDEKAEEFEKRKFSSSTNRAAYVDICIADTLELQTIRGVGPSRARGIFKYRQSLGGYYSIQQLREVFGIDSAVYAEIAPQVFIRDTSNIRKININTATAEQFGSHPYIGKKLAGLIVKYRDKHGAFSDVTAIKHMPLVNEDLFRKLAPYLKTQ